MSDLLFELRSGQITGHLTYHADPDWEVNQPETKGPITHFQCRNDQGTGWFLVFDREHNFFGTILRRDDTPYNDCLPPSEVLLKEGFNSDYSEAKEILKHVHNQADEDFYNPFNMLVADIDSNIVTVLKQSFQSSVDTFEEGNYKLSDGNDLQPMEQSPLIMDGQLPDLDTLQETIHEASDFPPKAEDGMRETACAILFEFGDNHLRLRFTMESSENTDWQEYTTETSLA